MMRRRTSSGSRRRRSADAWSGRVSGCASSSPVRGLTVPTGVLLAGAAGHAQASIPLALIHSTTRIALGFVSGNRAAVLAQGVLTSMLLTQLRVAAVMLCLGLGGSYSAWQTIAAAGDGKGQTQSNQKVPTVQLIHPPVRKIVRVVGQPSFVEAYERTPIYPKLTGYIEKSNVDIGDKVKKGDVLATLVLPELVEDLGTRQAKGKLGEQRVELAKKTVEVAAAEVKAAQVRLAEANAILAKYQAMVDRWDTEVKRLDREVKRGVVDPQVLVESTNMWKSSVAARDAAEATIAKFKAELLTKEAELAKAKVSVSVAQADLAVSTSEANRLEAWTGYPRRTTSTMVDAANTDVKAAQVRLTAVRASEAGSETDVDRWEAELKKLKRLIYPQALLNSINESNATTAVRDAARLAIQRCRCA